MIKQLRQFFINGIIRKMEQYDNEMIHINEQKALGEIPDGTFLSEATNLRYEFLELKLNTVMAFLPKSEKDKYLIGRIKSAVDRLRELHKKIEDDTTWMI